MITHQPANCHSSALNSGFILRLPVFAARQWGSFVVAFLGAQRQGCGRGRQADTGHAEAEMAAARETLVPRTAPAALKFGEPSPKLRGGRVSFQDSFRDSFHEVFLPQSGIADGVRKFAHPALLVNVISHTERSTIRWLQKCNPFS